MSYEYEEMCVPSWEEAEMGWENSIMKKAKELGCSYDEALEVINQEQQKEWEESYRKEINRLVESGMTRQEAEDAYIPF